MSTRALVVSGLILSALVAAILSFYASPSPDGLEFVAGSVGIGAGTEHAASGSPLADYAVAGVENARASGGAAGLAGVLVVGLLAWGLVRLLARRTRASS